MEKLIEFLRDAKLLNLNDPIAITIEMTQEEFDKENFFSNYIEAVCTYSIPVGWGANKEEIRQIKSIVSPYGFTLTIKIKE